MFVTKFPIVIVDSKRCTRIHTHARARANTNFTMVLLFEIEDNFSKVRMTMNDTRCAVVVEHLVPGQTFTSGVEVGVPLSLGYDERGRVV